MRILADTMDEFSECPGLQINGEKSQLFAGGVHGRELNKIASIIGFPLRELLKKYLGVSLNSTRLKAAHYSPLLDEITAFTKKWTGKKLSYVGRTELIKSILQGVECYWLQVFPLPGTVIDRIVRVARQFLWGSKKNPVAWKTLCLPKTEGGLGLRSLKSWNKALLSRVLWDIFSKKDSLWIKWVHNIYIGQRSLWDWNAQARDPQLIKSLLGIRDEMLQHHSRAEVERLWELGYKPRARQRHMSGSG